MAAIEMRHIRKNFGALTIIPDLDLTVNDGEFFVLVGPSGCGKSTLLRLIAGLEEISDGELQIDGKVVTDLPVRHRDIAMVFQNYALYPHMTVRENMAFSMRLRHAPDEDVTKAVDEAAAVLGLTELLDRLPKQLSGGQRQRVAMGRAIVRNPKVFLFDEPLSNLDAKLRVQMRTEIKALQKRLGTTTIYVTHDQSEAMTMADRIVLLNNGKIEQVGAPLDVYDSPNTVFSAGFIGSPSINLLDGRIEMKGDRPLVRIGDASVAAPPIKAAVSDGMPVVYGIRPEQMSLVDAGGLPATVHLVEPNGPDTLIIAFVGETEVRMLTQQRVNLSSGETIHFSPNIDGALLFEPSTGTRLF